MPRAAGSLVPPADTLSVKNTAGLAPVSSEKHILTVSIDDVGPSPLQPRQHIKDSDSDELFQSIKTYGVIEPLIVRERPDAARGAQSRYELAAGERRWTAAKRAGLTDVDVVVRELTDAHMIEFGLVENCRRADLHPMDEAAAYERLMQMDRAYTPESLAERVGKDVSTVRKRVKLLQLRPAIRAAFLVDTITVKHAEKLATLPAERQEKAFIEACFSTLLLDLPDDLTAEERVIFHEGGGIIAVLIARSAWPMLALALKSVGELDAWMRDHTAADLSDPAVQAALPELREFIDESADEADPAASSLLNLSADRGLSRDEKKALHVLTPDRDYKRVVGKRDRCAAMRKGCIVHGAPLQLVDVCADKKCEKHWPKPVESKSGQSSTAKAAAPRVSWEEQERQRKAAQDAWEQQLARLAPLVTAHLERRKLTATAALLRHAMGRDGYRLDRAVKTFKVALSDKTVPVLMALAGLETWDLNVFTRSAKQLGFDTAKAIKQLEAEGKSTAAAKLGAALNNLRKKIRRATKAPKPAARKVTKAKGKKAPKSRRAA